MKAAPRQTRQWKRKRVHTFTFSPSVGWRATCCIPACTQPYFPTTAATFSAARQRQPCKGTQRGGSQVLVQALLLSFPAALLQLPPHFSPRLQVGLPNRLWYPANGQAARGRNSGWAKPHEGVQKPKRLKQRRRDSRPDMMRAVACFSIPPPGPSAGSSPVLAAVCHHSQCGGKAHSVPCGHVNGPLKAAACEVAATVAQARAPTAAAAAV